MLRCICMVLILISGNVMAAEYSCSDFTWDETEYIYKGGLDFKRQMEERYDILCESNPECVFYQSKDQEIEQLREIKDSALDRFYEARTRFVWIADHCGFKLKYSAKANLATVESNIEKVIDDFEKMQRDCLHAANKIANSFKCR